MEGGEEPEGLDQIPAQKLQRFRYRFDEELEEDQEGQREPQRFKGFLDESQYASTPANTSGGGGASYAIMIYDAKKNVFKLVPVEKHFKFEKEVKIKRQRQKAQLEGEPGQNSVAQSKAKKGPSKWKDKIKNLEHTLKEKKHIKVE